MGKERVSKTQSALKWVKVVTPEPPGGKELINEKLAKALASKTEFTTKEWDAFGIKDLLSEAFVNAGGAYFVPANVVPDVAELALEAVHKLGIGQKPGIEGAKEEESDFRKLKLIISV